MARHCFDEIQKLITSSVFAAATLLLNHVLCSSPVNYCRLPKKYVFPAFQHSNIFYRYLCHCDSRCRLYIPKVVGQHQTACAKEHQNWPFFSRLIAPFSFLQIFQSFSFPRLYNWSTPVGQSFVHPSM